MAQLKYWNGTAWVAAVVGAAGAASNTTVVTGDLTNLGTTSSPYLGLATVGTAGTYTKVTTDAKGRIIAGTTLSSSDIPILSPSKITGTAITQADVGTISAAMILDGSISNVEISPSAAIANSKLANSSISINGVAASLGASVTITASPTGTASGDLVGTYPSPTLAAVGTSGTYTKVTTDSKGRVTSGTTLGSSDIPSIAESQVTNLVTDLGLKAPLASPTFTGVPASVTVPADNSSTNIATTAFVLGQLGTALPLSSSSTALAGSSTRFARQDHVHPTDTSRASAANPTFTGIVTTPFTSGVIKSSSGGVLSSGAILESDVTGLVSDLALKSPLVNPTFTTPTLGVATATSINGTAIPSVSTLLTSVSAIPESQVTNLISDLSAKANLNSPAFTGTVTAPLTAGFVKSSSVGVLSSAAIAESDVTNLVSDLAAKASLVSPSFTTPSLGAATATSINATAIPSSATLLTTSSSIAESQVTNLVSDLGLKANLSGATFTGAVTGTDLTVNTLTVTGSQTIINTANLLVNDSIIYLADSQYALDAVDIGIYGAYGSAGGTVSNHKHTGMVRDHLDGIWKIFSNGNEPTTSVIDFTGVTYDGLKIGSLNIAGLTSAGYLTTTSGGAISSVATIPQAGVTGLPTALGLLAPLASPSFTTPSLGAATATSINGTAIPAFGTLLSTTSTIPESQVTNLISDLAAKASIASPTFTGTPASSTAVVNTNTTQIATTAFVIGQAGTASPLVAGTVAVGTSLLYSRQDHVHPTDTTRAPAASPTFSGVITTPLTTGVVKSTSGVLSSGAIAESDVTNLVSDLALKAPLLSPSFTTPTLGVATATSINGTSVPSSSTLVTTTSAATVAPLVDGTAAVGTSLLYARQDHVHGTDTTRAPTASPTFSGTVTVSPFITAGFVKNSATGVLSTGTIAESDVTNLVTDLGLKAPLASPTFTGTPLLTASPATNDNSLKIASTAYVVGQAGTASPLVNNTVAVGTSLLYARQDHVHPIDTSRAPAASPTFSGTVTVSPFTVAGFVKNSAAGALSSAVIASTDLPTVSGLTTGTPFANATVTVDTYGRVTAIAAGTTAVLSVAGTSGSVTVTGTTAPVVSLTAAYGDSVNPYASKTAAFVLAAPTAIAGVPTFRALAATDIPAIAESGVTNLVSDLALKAPLLSPSFTTPALGVATATSITSPLVTPAGTLTVPAISMTQTSNLLTTPAAGAIEYDGTTATLTQNTSFGRAPIATPVFTSGIGTSGIAVTTNYALFPTANDTITLPIGIYRFETSFAVTVATSTTSTGLSFTVRGAGTAVGTMTWDGTGSITAAGAATQYQQAATALTSVLTVGPASAVAGRQYTIKGTGLLRVTTAGTIIPSYQFPISPVSGVVTLYADNYLVLTPLATGSTAVSTGAWN